MYLLADKNDLHEGEFRPKTLEAPQPRARLTIFVIFVSLEFVANYFRNEFMLLPGPRYSYITL